MIGTAKEIAIEMLRDDDNDGEKFVFASWSRNDIRGLCIGHYDVIRGSLPLQQALEKVAESGDCAATARHLLEAGK